jgi:hypothetical protein
MKTETTPAPWFVDGHNITAVIANEGSLEWPKWKHVCTCDYGYADPEKYFELNKANARLIAQTPYMLELLKQCVTTFDILKLQNVFKDDLSLRNEIKVLIERLDKVN